VAREFEAAVDEYILTAVNQTPQQAATAAAKANKGPIAKAQSAKASGSGRSSPKSVGGDSGRSTPKNMPANIQQQQQQAPSAAAITAATEAAAAAMAPPAHAEPTKKS
jgi:hypothetical protein